MHRDKKLRETAKGQGCTMHSPMCNYDAETTVWCHSDYYEHGRGFGKLKAHDCFGFHGCSGCNYWYDYHSRQDGTPKEVRFEYWRKAFERTVLRLWETETIGVIK